MIAVGKKHGPAVRLVLAGPDVLGRRREARSIGIDALERTLSIGRKEDYTLASPSAAASGQSGGERLRRASGDRHLLQLAVGEEPNVSAIRRPERITRALCPRQRRHV